MVGSAAFPCTTVCKEKVPAHFFLWLGSFLGGGLALDNLKKRGEVFANICLPAKLGK